MAGTDFLKQPLYRLNVRLGRRDRIFSDCERTFARYRNPVALFLHKISSGWWFRVLFHILFWTYWLAGPFLAWENDEDRLNMLLRLFPMMLTNIPLFFINTEWLAPRLLRKRGIAPYLLSLAALVAVFALVQVAMKSWLLHCPFENELQSSSRVFFAVMFVTAVSTGYALTTYLASQEKAREQERRERLQSELSFLRSQISPHFIFNILNSIVYLIRSRSALAEPVTIKLSELMRYMLYESADSQIALEKELEYLENYIDLQKIRFEEDVDIRFQVEGRPGAWRIEPMLMIPFVENAFKHGVGMIAEPVIDVLATIDEQELNFSVRNKIAPGGADVKDGSSGIGLRNVTRRLELLYPDKHRLDIRQENNWFIVQLNLRLHP